VVGGKGEVREQAKRGLVLSTGSFPRGGTFRNDGGRVKEEGTVPEFFFARAIRLRIRGHFLSTK